MPVSTPVLNLTIFDSHDDKLLVIGDASTYPTNFNIVSPTLGITIPGYPEKQIEFNAQNINIYNSNSLKITCNVDVCDLEPLPDGVYTIKYAIVPAYKYNVTKSFFRVDRLYQKFDEKFLTVETLTCDSQMKRNLNMMIDDAEFYIKGAISAANKCANKVAMEWYRKASAILDKI